MKKFNRKQREQNRRKLENNKEKTEFIATMHHMIDLIGGEGTFALLPPHVVENSYTYRSLPIKPSIKYDPEQNMQTVNNLHRTVTRLTHKKDFNIPIKGEDFTLYEFMTVGITLLRLVIISRDKEPESWQTKFGSRFTEGIEKELADLAFQRMCHLAMVLTLGEYNLQRDFYWFKIQLDAPHEGSNQLQYVMYEYRIKHEKRIFNTASGEREGLRVSFALVNSGVVYAYFDTSLLGVDYPNEKVPVYIQQHAVRRLEERLEGLKSYNLQISAFESFFKPIVIKRNKNNVFIACCINDVKMGYFVAEYIQEALLIHTFLFITHDGTPEGNKLSELTGLGKLDKKYLAIDRLSSFISSDISHNLLLRNLFCSVGCSCLFEINEMVNRSALKKEEQFLSELILKYLDLRE